MEACFLEHDFFVLIPTDRFQIVRAKSKEHLNDYTNITKSFGMASNSKHRTDKKYKKHRRKYKKDE